MKILAIIGSPRKGNSYKITQQVESEMKKLDNDVSFEYIFLSDMDIQPCKGCFLCLSKGEEFCPLKDDRDAIAEKMLNSDGFILVSPVYVMHVTGLMKNFIDRMAYVCHRPAFFNQHAMAISTTGALGLKDVLNYLADVARVWMANSVVKLGLESPPHKANAMNLDQTVDKKVVKSAKTFYENIKFQKHRSPSLMQVIQFRAQQAIFTLPDSQEKTPLSADYRFYQKLSGKKFYVDRNVNMYKNMIGWIVGKIVAWQSKKGIKELEEIYSKNTKG